VSDTFSLKSLIGKGVIIRTVTMNYLGKLESIQDDCYVLSTASWLAESVRWSEALATGKLRDNSRGEVEPYPGLVWVSRKGESDISEWKHALPTTAI